MLAGAVSGAVVVGAVAVGVVVGVVVVGVVGVSACVVLIFVGAALWPAHANAPAPASLPLALILALMEDHDQIQREGLKHYTAIRQYHVEYRGLANLEARMEVEVDFDATSGKSFRTWHSRSLR